MTNEEIKQFYRDISDVCKKYKMNGVTGIWFSGNGHDEFGSIEYWDMTDSRMRAVITFISEKYQRWAKDAFGHIPKPIGQIREVRSDEGGAKQN